MDAIMDVALVALAAAAMAGLGVAAKPEPRRIPVRRRSDRPRRGSRGD